MCAQLEALISSSSSGNVGTETSVGQDGLAAAPAPADIFSKVRALRGLWQQESALRGIEPERAASLDRRFTTALLGVAASYPAEFNRTDLDPDANRRRMEDLVHRVEGLASALGIASVDPAQMPATKLATMLKEALAANTIGGRVHEENRWRGAQEDVRQAQAAWARIGLVPEPARHVLTDRFERACRQILQRPGEAGESGVSGGSGRGRTV